jgi:hypothetical protein
MASTSIVDPGPDLMSRSVRTDYEALRVFEKHPEAEAYHVGGSFTPYAIVAVDKRLSDGELAAEWHKQDNHCGQKLEGYAVAHNGEPLGTEEEEIDRLRTFHRFATLPHFDE